MTESLRTRYAFETLEFRDKAHEDPFLTIYETPGAVRIEIPDGVIAELDSEIDRREAARAILGHGLREGGSTPPKGEPAEWVGFEVMDEDGDRLRIRNGSVPNTLFVLPCSDGVYLTRAQALDLGRRLIAWADGR